MGVSPLKKKARRIEQLKRKRRTGRREHSPNKALNYRLERAFNRKKRDTKGFRSTKAVIQRTRLRYPALFK